MLAAMAREISLTVTIDVEPAHHAPALDGLLPDGGTDGLPLASLSHDLPAFSHREKRGSSGISRHPADGVEPLKAAWQQGRKELFYPYGKTYAQTIGEQD
jgi:hypothetical protein